MKQFLAFSLMISLFICALAGMQPGDFKPTPVDSKAILEKLHKDFDLGKKVQLRSSHFSNSIELEPEIQSAKDFFQGPGAGSAFSKVREIFYKIPSSPLALPTGVKAILGDHRFRQSGKLTGCLFHPRLPQILLWGEDGVISTWDAWTGMPLARIVAHKETVHQVVVHPKENWIASTGEDRVIGLWDLNDGKKLKSLELGSEVVSAIAFSHTGEFLACGGKDRKLKILSTLEWKIQHDIAAHNLGITSVAFHPAKAIAASVSADRMVRLVDAQSGNVLGASTPFRGTIYSVRFSPDGSSLALAGSEPNSVKILDSSSLVEKQTIDGHQGPVLSVDFSRDGKFLVSAGTDQAIKIWDLQNNRSVQAFTSDLQEIRCVAISPDGKTVAATGSNSALHAWNLENSQQNISLLAGKFPLWCVAWSPDGTKIAAAGSDKILRIWSTSTWKELQQLKGHEAAITAIAFHTGGQAIASAGADKTLKIWQLDKEGSAKTYRSHNATITCLAYSPDGKYLATGGADQCIHIWEPPGEKPLRIIQAKTIVSSLIWPDTSAENFYWAGGDRAIHEVNAKTGAEIASHSVAGEFLTAICQGLNFGHFFAASSNARLTMLNQAGTPPSRVLSGPTGILSGIDSSKKSQKLAVGGADQNIYLWNLRQLDKPLQWRAHDDWISSLAFKPDGNYLASTGMDGFLKVWNLGRDSKFQPKPGHASEIKALAAALTGNLLASAAADGSLCLWDFTSPKLLGILNENSEPVSALALAKDGKTLVAGNHLGDLLVFSTSPFKQVNRFSSGSRGDTLALLHLPENRILSLISPNIIEVRDLSNGEVVQKSTVPALPSTPSCIAFHPLGKLFFIGTKDGKVIPVELGVETPNPSQLFPVLDDQIIDLAIPLARQAEIFALSKGGKIRSWNRENSKGKTIYEATSPALAFAVDSAGGRLAVICADSVVRCIETNTGKITKEWAFPKGGNPSMPNPVLLQWSSDSQSVFLGNRDGSIFQLDPK